MKNPDTGVMSVLAKAVLFTYLFREDDEVSEILSTIDRGECKASMECIFSKFAAVHPSTGEVLPHIVDEQMLIQNLRAGKAARRFLNPLFTSAAILNKIPPADPDAAVEADDINVYDGGFKFFVTDASFDSEAVKRKKKKKKKKGKARPKSKPIWASVQTAKDQHKISHTIYNRIKTNGVFDDLTLEYALDLHDACVKVLTEADVDHDTPLESTALSHVTVSLLDAWLAKAGVPYMIQEDGLFLTDHTKVWCVSDSDKESLLSEIPIEHRGGVNIHRSDKLRYDPDMIGSYEIAFENLLEKLKDRGALWYNSNDALILTCVANALRQTGYICSVSLGNVETLGLSDTIWIEFGDHFAYVKDQDFIITETEDHFLNATMTVDALDIEAIGSIVELKGGSKKALRSLTSTSSLDYETLSLYNAETVAPEGELEVWKDLGIPSVLWKTNAKLGISGNISVELENSDLEKAMSRIKGSFAYEGYLVEDLFYVTDVLYGNLIESDTIQKIQTRSCKRSDLMRVAEDLQATRSGVCFRDSKGQLYKAIPKWLLKAKVCESEGTSILLEIGDTFAYADKSYVFVKPGDEVMVGCDYISSDKDDYYFHRPQILKISNDNDSLG
jgi:uncharacterized protein YfcZ (UPF0381/DUF406 family)